MSFSLSKYDHETICLAQISSKLIFVLMEKINLGDRIWLFEELQSFSHT